MNTDVPLPLSESQQRRLTVTFASLEKSLAELRERLERGPSDLRLTHYEDAINAAEVSLLLPTVQDAEAQVRKIADELGLEPLTKPVRRKIVAALELANINLYECRPESGFAGYGRLESSTADYLKREIPRLEAVIRSLIGLLQKAYNNASI